MNGPDLLDEPTTSSGERRIAIVERGLKRGAAYSGAGLLATVGGALWNYPGDKLVLGAGIVLFLRGSWLLLGTARRVRRRRRDHI